jgi:hypothetical protein
VVASYSLITPASTVKKSSGFGAIATAVGAGVGGAAGAAVIIIVVVVVVRARRRKSKQRPFEPPSDGQLRGVSVCARAFCVCARIIALYSNNSRRRSQRLRLCARRAAAGLAQLELVGTAVGR